MNILYCTTVLPSQRRTGGEIASQAFVDALRQAGHAVSVLGYRRPDDTSPLGTGEVLVGVRPIESNGAGLKPLAWMLSAFASGRPYSCEKYVSAAYRAELRTRLKANDNHPCIVLLDHAQVAFLADDISADQPFIFVAHNVEAQLYQSQARSQRFALKRWLLARESNAVGELELSLARRAVQTWVLTEQDAAAFKATSGGGSVIRCDLPGLASTGVHPVDAEIEWEIGLIGTWTWSANAQGLQWFMDQVVPLLPQGVRIAVAGKGAGDIVGAPIVSLGFVPNAMDFMRSCQVVCIPSIAGGGVQIKTIDAIASGRPIVATSTALRGIEGSPATVTMADDPKRFSSCLLAAMAAPTALSQKAVEWAASRKQRFETQIQILIGQLSEQ